MQLIRLAALGSAQQALKESLPEQELESMVPFSLSAEQLNTA